MNKDVFDKVSERAEGKCEVCGRYKDNNAQKHHALNKCNRKRLEYVGTVFNLCASCHEKAHIDRELDLELKRRAQKYLEEELGWDRDKCIKEIGRNYLD